MMKPRLSKASKKLIGDKSTAALYLILLKVPAPLGKLGHEDIHAPITAYCTIAI
jgi:hypothetical protein